MHEGKVLFAMVDNTCMLKLVGSIMVTNGLGFDRFITKILSQKTVESFIIDLTETVYIDSTNLGILAKLHDFMFKQSKPQPTIISTRKNINEVLESVGFPQIFTIIENPDSIPENFEEVPSMPCAQGTLAQLMLNTHRELMKLNETNRCQFKDVVTFLERDLLDDPCSACS